MRLGEAEGGGGNTLDVRERESSMRRWRQQIEGERPTTESERETEKERVTEEG